MSGVDYTVIINGIRFNDVTNQTVTGTTYNHEEAVAYTQGKTVFVSDREKKEDRG